MKYTLGTGAKACGVSRTTIFRAIKTGKISASKDTNGNYVIEPAELHRVYPTVTEKHNTQQQKERDALGVGTGETVLLRQENEFLKQQLEREKEFTRELSRRLDDEVSERRKLTAILTFEKPEKKVSQGFFSKLLRNKL